MEMLKGTFIEKETRSLFIHTFFYNPNVNHFITYKLLFEILPSGGVAETSLVRSEPIFENDQLIGAIGVSGASESEDEAIAKHGLKNL